MNIDLSNKLLPADVTVEEAVELVEPMLPFRFDRFMGKIQANLTNFLFNVAVEHKLANGGIGDALMGNYSHFEYTCDDSSEVGEWFDACVEKDSQALTNFAINLKKEDVTPVKFHIELEERGSSDEDDTYSFEVWGSVKLDNHEVGISAWAHFYCEDSLDELCKERELIVLDA